MNPRTVKVMTTRLNKRAWHFELKRQVAHIPAFVKLEREKNYRLIGCQILVSTLFS